jgi:hypothetical protein
MSKEKLSSIPTHQPKNNSVNTSSSPESRQSRRAFIGNAGALTAATLTAGLLPSAGSKGLESQAATQLKLSRCEMAYRIRQQAALNEKNRSAIRHITNGDNKLYPNGIASFTKCLPHNSLGEVEPEAYKALLRALETNDFNDFEAIPLGGFLKLANPLAGMTFNIAGPDPCAIGVNAPPTFNSDEMSAEMAELYWMALLRDLPFKDYNTSPLADEAAKDLSKFACFKGPRDPKTGAISPDQLFRVNYSGAMDGSMVSQFLLMNSSLDGVDVQARIKTILPAANGDGVDFLTDYDEWLASQRGFPRGTSPGQNRYDPTPRYIRNARDLGRCVDESALITIYVKAALSLLRLGREGLDDNNPYKRSKTQGGFGSFGFGDLIALLGHIGSCGRHVGYQKWQVHRLLRPEAFSGRVHNHLTCAAKYPISEELLKSPALEKIFEHNAAVNRRRNLGRGSYLLPGLFPTGSPTHPSFPAGHAVVAGVGVALLKAWFNEDMILPDSMTQKVNHDGSALEPYRAGVDGPALTVGGELNKLAHNFTIARNMSGIHYRFDGVEGNKMGEEIAIRTLAEARATYSERFNGFTITKFDGSRVTV